MSNFSHPASSIDHGSTPDRTSLGLIRHLHVWDWHTKKPTTANPIVWKRNTLNSPWFCASVPKELSWMLSLTPTQAKGKLLIQNLGWRWSVPEKFKSNKTQPRKKAASAVSHQSGQL